MRPATRITVAVAAVALCGCVDGFRGANVQLDLFKPAVPVQAHVVGAPAPGELPANVHFSLYAIQQDAMQDRLFEVARFEVHRIVDLSSPCFIDVGEHVPHPGLHVSQYAAKIAQDTGIADLANPPATATEQQKELAATAIQRQMNVGALADSAAGIVAVTSASASTYPAVAPGCTGPADQIPPATCTDDASNELRLKLCQSAWKADPNLWEGTDRVLTAPLAGITHGMVNGTNPISHTPVGGAQIFVDNALENIDAYAIYFQADGMDTPGTQLYFGRPMMLTRGVQHVDLVSPINPLAQAKMAVFADLGQDDVHF